MNKDTQNIAIILVVACALYSGALNLQPTMLGNAELIEMLENRSIWHWPKNEYMPDGQPVLRPVSLFLLRTRLPLAKLDPDILFAFNIAIVAACGAVLYLVLRQVCADPSAALLLALFFITDFRIRRGITTIDASAVLAFLFGCSALLAILANHKTWILPSILFSLGCFSKELGFFFAPVLILLSSRRYHIASTVMTAVALYLTCRWFVGSGSVFTYVNTFTPQDKVGALINQDLGWSGYIYLWIRNISVALLGSLVPQLVSYGGRVSLDGFVSKIKMLETAVFLLLWWRAISKSVDRTPGYMGVNTTLLGIMLILCGAAAQFLYYTTASSLLSFGGVCVIVCTGLSVSKPSWYYLLWLLLGYRVMIMAKYLTIFIKDMTSI